MISQDVLAATTSVALSKTKSKKLHQNKLKLDLEFQFDLSVPNKDLIKPHQDRSFYLIIFFMHFCLVLIEKIYIASEN